MQDKIYIVTIGEGAFFVVQAENETEAKMPVEALLSKAGMFDIENLVFDFHTIDSVAELKAYDENALAQGLCTLADVFPIDCTGQTVEEFLLEQED